MNEEFPVAVEVTQATVLRCCECGRAWLDEHERWRLKVLFEERVAETVPYCPSCHEREFGS
jgi:acetone carboxylase gamma subunit